MFVIEIVQTYEVIGFNDVVLVLEAVHITMTELS